MSNDPLPGPASDPASSPTEDAVLIDRLRPVLRAGVAAAVAAAPAAGAAGRDSSRPALHAEAAHQLCLTDGLLELLEWTREGVAADPLACLWLGSLRWHRLVTGRFPEGAPEPPAREVDRALAGLLQGRRPALALGPGGEVSRTGLADGQMAYPSAPAQPEEDDRTGLLRLIPLALVPYVEESLLLSWTDQALALTQGHPEAHAAARRLISAVRGLAVTRAPAPGQLEDALDVARGAMAGADAVAVAAVTAQVRAAAGSLEAPTLPQELDQLLEQTLLEPWERVTAPV